MIIQSGWLAWHHTKRVPNGTLSPTQNPRAQQRVNKNQWCFTPLRGRVSLRADFLNIIIINIPNWETESWQGWSCEAWHPPFWVKENNKNLYSLTNASFPCNNGTEFTNKRRQITNKELSASNKSILGTNVPFRSVHHPFCGKTEMVQVKCWLPESVSTFNKGFY